jgi:hypothetical protein
MGRLSIQVKQSEVQAAPRTILGTSHISTRESRRTVGKPYPAAMNRRLQSGTPLPKSFRIQQPNRIGRLRVGLKVIRVLNKK